MSGPEAPGDKPYPTLDAIATLLGPLARLALAHGVTVTLLEEALRRALVQAARDTLLAQGLAEHRLVSRISASTGLTRREVTRLSQELADRQMEVKGAPTSEVFTRWAADARAWPRILPRSGPGGSFDALARSVTQDVHPRTLLDEMVRLGLARVSDDGESVERLKNDFTPTGDQAQMLAYLAANVGSHLAGSVSNVVGAPGPRHFDQAVFADELAAASIPHVQAFVTSQWQRLFSEAVPLLEARIEEDKRSGQALNKRMRIGLYTYEDEAPPARITPAVAPAAPGTSPAPAPTGAAPAGTRKTRNRRNDHG